MKRKVVDVLWTMKRKVKETMDRFETKSMIMCWQQLRVRDDGIDDLIKTLTYTFQPEQIFDWQI